MGGFDIVRCRRFLGCHTSIVILRDGKGKTGMVGQLRIAV